MSVNNLEDSNMSDRIRFVEVEELIARIFNAETFVVDFNILRCVLLMLVTQIRLVEQEVELRFTEKSDLLGIQELGSQDLLQVSVSTGTDDIHSGSDEKGRKAKSKRPAESETVSTIAVTEVSKPGSKSSDGKILIVEKGPTTIKDSRDSQPRIGSIDVVTLSQFELLQDAVKELMTRVEHTSTPPTMPDDAKLMSRLSQGTATLPDVMEAVQLKERVEAAERALTRMAVLLTRLVAAGVIPPEVAEAFAEMARSMGIPQDVLDELESILKPKIEDDKLELPEEPEEPPPPKFVGVTHLEMQKAIVATMNIQTKKIEDLMNKAYGKIELQEVKAKAIVDKLDDSIKMNNRIDELLELFADYGLQLDGFSGGLEVQLVLYKEQVAQMQLDLDEALTVAGQAGNRPDSPGLSEVKENYGMLKQHVDQSTYWHQQIVNIQQQRGLEVGRIVECVEVLREQLADRDEVEDRLRDKADLQRLTAIITISEFDLTRSDLEQRLEKCSGKFAKQKEVWLRAIEELTDIAVTKVDKDLLENISEFAEEQLNKNMEMLHDLAVLLGRPKTLMLASFFDTPTPRSPPAQSDSSQKKNVEPVKLPPIIQAEPLHKTCVQLQKDHMCRRFAGGSHTLMLGNVTHEVPHMDFGIRFTKPYVDSGPDKKRTYFMETELQPCIECNELSSSNPIVGPRPSKGAGGDTAVDA